MKSRVTGRSSDISVFLLPICGGVDCPPYRDAWTLVHGRHPHVPTFCVHDHTYSKEPYCCDFVFVSETLASRVHDVGVASDTRASDHQPVILDLDDR